MNTIAFQACIQKIKTARPFEQEIGPSFHDAITLPMPACLTGCLVCCCRTGRAKGQTTVRGRGDWKRGQQVQSSRWQVSRHCCRAPTADYKTLQVWDTAFAHGQTGLSTGMVNPHLTCATSFVDRCDPVTRFQGCMGLKCLDCRVMQRARYNMQSCMQDRFAVNFRTCRCCCDGGVRHHAASVSVRVSIDEPMEKLN